MRCPTLGSVVLLGLASAFAAAPLVAPGQVRTAGLDFWNSDDAAAQLRTATAERQDWDFEREQYWHREAVTDDIAGAFCEDRIDLPEALAAAATLADQFPEWVGQVRGHYLANGMLPPTATDRDVMARYLRVRIESMIVAATSRGDAPRVARLTLRLCRFDHEMPGPAPSPDPQPSR